MKKWIVLKKKAEDFSTVDKPMLALKEPEEDPNRLVRNVMVRKRLLSGEGIV